MFELSQKERDLISQAKENALSKGKDVWGVADYRDDENSLAVWFYCPDETNIHKEVITKKR